MPQPASVNPCGQDEFEALEVAPISIPPLNVSIINPLDNPYWDDLLSSADGATFFHTAAWARVLSESYGYTPLYFSIVADGRLKGLIPVMEIRSFLTGKRGVSLPFSDMCEPIASDPETFDALLGAAAQHGRNAGWKHLELRGGAGFLQEKPACAQHLLHTLELGGDEVAVSRGFKANIRRNIRKAEKEGVQVTFECSLASMAAFYKLNCGTRRHHGLPPQPWPFFRKLYEHVIAAGQGLLAMATYRNRMIAGAVFTIYRDQAIYKYGASDRAFHQQRPNNLVMWEAIRRFCREGITRLNFGRSEPRHQGLVQFKRNWGAAEGTTRYHRLDLRTNAFVSGSAGLTSSYGFFRQMPEPVLRMVGSVLYRHVG